MTDESDELWHVRMSADEVKILTLEQIDDLFRLEVIDADTQLWQPGMDEWLPLRVVAGLDEEEVVSVSVPPSAPPAAFAATNASWPPAVAARGAASSFPPPPPSSRAPAPPSSRAPAPPSSRAPAPPSSRAPAPSGRPPIVTNTNSSWPPTVASSSQAPAEGVFAQTVPQSSRPPRPIVPMSAPPLVADPPAYMQPRSRVAVLPIALAAAAGLIVTLYRNEVVHAALRTVGQEAAYLKLESALGGPGFGTPRAVAEMAKATALLPNIELEPSVSEREDSSEPSSSDSSARSGSSSGTTGTKASKPAKPAPKPAVAPPRPQPRPAAAPAHHPTFNAPKKATKAKGNEYDPLNPSL